MENSSEFGVLGTTAITGLAGAGIGLGAGVVNLYARGNQWDKDVHTLSTALKAIPEIPHC
ncbi:hypothetical protein [Chroococcidiopsis sp.]|uniref:hypothetical protein n=1 Tax=Chroococcidiopsis sp. TaxID=3088168 RepID=UPI003F67484B